LHPGLSDPQLQDEQQGGKGKSGVEDGNPQGEKLEVTTDEVQIRVGDGV
jgi:hypothetical protein